MEESKMLEILNRIKSCIEHNSLMISKDLVQLELNNLKEFTDKNCRNTKYYYYNWNCKHCSNFNCKANQNNQLI